MMKFAAWHKEHIGSVLQAKNPGLVHNSCDFLLLEEKCRSYTMEKSKEKVMSKETEWER